MARPAPAIAATLPAAPAAGLTTLLPHPTALLLGLGLAWQWAGLRTIVGAQLDPSPTTVTMLGTIVLLMAAVGPRIPPKFAVRLARLIRGRQQPPPADLPDPGNGFWLLRAWREPDPRLLWLSLAVLASSAGFLAILTLALVAPLASLHEALIARFFWTRLTASALEWALVALLAGGLWLMNGLLVAALAPVIGARSGSREAEPVIPGALLLAAGAALGVHELLADGGLSGSQAMLLGSLPVFGLSALSAALSHREEQRPTPAAAPSGGAPELTGRAEGWIWMCLVAWGAGAALAVSGWLSCQAALVAAARSPGLGAGAALAAIGLGTLLAPLAATRENLSATGCGTVVWAAGAAAGAVAVAAAISPPGTASALPQLALLALPLGYALHYVGRSWLARAGSETLGFAQMTSAVLAGGAIGLLLTRWWVEPILGPLGALTTGGLVLMASGGLTQIHGDAASPAPRGRRLALVFASLAAAIVLFPASTERWSRRALPPAKTSPAVPLSDGGPLGPTGRVCLIGVPPEAAAGIPDAGAAAVDCVPHWGDPAPPPAPAGPVRLLSAHALRLPTLGAGRYDLIYQNGQAAGDGTRFAGYSAEWLARLADRAAPGGRVILDVPLAGQTPASLAVVAATFQHAMRGEGLWRLVGPEPSDILRLLARPEPGETGEPPVTGAWHPIGALVDPPGAPALIHSLHRDRMTRARARPAGDPGPTLLDWLRRRADS